MHSFLTYWASTEKKTTMKEPFTETSLKKLCLVAVGKHFHLLNTDEVLCLPNALTKELLTHLTVCHLEKIQPALNQRGISTYDTWQAMLKNLWGVDCGTKFPTENEAKEGVMTSIFPLVLYGYKNHFILSNPHHFNNAFLTTAAKYVKHFSCMSQNLHFSKVFQDLTSGPDSLLTIFEKNLQSITLTDSIGLSKAGTELSLYIIHRLFDHGVATKLFVITPNPITLSLLFHGRGTQYENPALKKLLIDCGYASAVPTTSAESDESSPSSSSGSSTSSYTSSDDDGDYIPCKRSRSSSSFECDTVKCRFNVNPEVLCEKFGQRKCNAGGPRSRGVIEVLKINLNECDSDSAEVLVSALPTFYSLRSLIIYKTFKFNHSEMLDLISALKKLSDSGRGQLTELDICGLPDTTFIENLLNACKGLKSLSVEVQNLLWRRERFLSCDNEATKKRKREERRSLYPTAAGQWPLEKLTVKVNEFHTNLDFITSVLKRCPNLTSLHLACLRLPTNFSLKPLFYTLKEYNPCLKILNLEDMKLSDCLTETLNLLKHCRLEELELNDCRLLEKSSNTERSLRKLVFAVKKIRSLRILSLAQNRLARDVCVLAELFSGDPPTSLEHLNINSNFILPRDLMGFAMKLNSDQFKHKIVLDLRYNPADRDPELWKAALKKLNVFTIVASSGWKSVKMLMDHLSNM